MRRCVDCNFDFFFSNLRGFWISFAEISQKRHINIKQKLLQYNENMTIHCFFQHNKQIVENNNKSQIILFDEMLQLTVCFTDENENEQIHKNGFKIVYKADSHNVKHWQKQNRNVVKHECHTRVFNYELWKIDLQFLQKKRFNMNHQLNRLNSFFCKSKKHYIVIYKSHHEKIYNSHKFVIKSINVVHFLFCFLTSVYWNWSTNQMCTSRR